MSIQVQGIRKTFGSFVAVDDVSLDFPTGQLIALLGPSGCGKTTLLRIIAGLERAEQGRVLFDGQDASDRDVRERHVGFVFQHYASVPAYVGVRERRFGLRVKPRHLRPSEAPSASASTSCLSWCSSAGSSIAIPRSCRVGSASALRWPARWPSSRACCSWTSRSVRLMPR
jgi:sulfate transport system ATP-binding protein